MFDFLTPEFMHHLIESYGLWILFALVMLESSGIPMPGETALMSAAYYAGATHRLDIMSVVAVAAAAAIVGDNIGYLAGRTIGFRLIVRHGRYLGLTEPRLKVGQYLFLQHGGTIVFFGRFVAFLRAFAALLAGINHMRWPKFLLMNALGGICWASLFGFGAYLFGHQIEMIAGPFGIVLLVAAIALTVTGTILFRRHEKELEERAMAALPGPLG